MGPDQARLFVMPDPGPNGLESLSADAKFVTAGKELNELWTSDIDTHLFTHEMCMLLR